VRNGWEKDFIKEAKPRVKSNRTPKGADSKERKGGGVVKGEVQDGALQEVLDGWTL